MLFQRQYSPFSLSVLFDLSLDAVSDSFDLRTVVAGYSYSSTRTCFSLVQYGTVLCTRFLLSYCKAPHRVGCASIHLCSRKYSGHEAGKKTASWRFAAVLHNARWMDELTVRRSRGLDPRCCSCSLKTVEHFAGRRMPCAPTCQHEPTSQDSCPH